MRSDEVERRILEELASGMRTPEGLCENTRVGMAAVNAALERLAEENLVEPSRMVYPRGTRQSALVLYKLTPAGLRRVNSDRDGAPKTFGPSTAEMLEELEELELDLLDTVHVPTNTLKTRTAMPSSHPRRGRLCWYVGLVLIAIGVVGFVGFSVLHDALKIPLVGQAFDSFGSVNRLSVFLGVVLQAVGISFLFFSEFTIRGSPPKVKSQVY
ncbi:MAG: hypothetical protein ACE5QF_05860 [Thermoplasmata archaeon]